MILITGATGNLGGSVVKHLINLESDEFIIMARNQEKARQWLDNGLEVRIADLNNIEELEAALLGIDKVLLISTMEENRFEQHKNMIDASLNVGVKHVVYTSLAINDIKRSHVNYLMRSHFQTEEYLIQSGLNYTILRNTMYADAIPEIIGNVIETKSIRLPGGEGKVPYVLRNEMGEGIAKLLLGKNHENRIYNIVGTNSYSYEDISNELGRLKGEIINYEDISDEEYSDFLRINRMSEFQVYLTQGTVRDVKEMQYEIEDQTLSSLLGRETKTLKKIILELFD